MSIDDVINVLHGTIDFIEGMKPDDKDRMILALEEAIKHLQNDKEKTVREICPVCGNQIIVILRNGKVEAVVSP